MSLVSQLTKSQRASLQREYDQIRMRDLDEQDRRKEYVKEQCPQIFTIRAQIADISAQAVTSQILNKSQEGPVYTERLDELEERGKEYLKNLDLPEDYLDPVFACPICHDTGFLPDGRPCSCYINKAVRLLYGNKNNQYIDPDASFDKFSLGWYSTAPDEDGKSPRQKAEDSLGKAQDFVHTLRQRGGYGNILLYGVTGTGKTFLTNCIVNELLKSNVNVIYFSAIDLFDAMSYTNRLKQRAEGADSSAFVTDCDLLVIDDLGSEKTSFFSTSILFNVINSRLNLRKSTLISTNYMPTQLRTVYTERISSRIMGNYQLLQLSGQDIRMQKLYANHPSIMKADDHGIST